MNSLGNAVNNAALGVLILLLSICLIALLRLRHREKRRLKRDPRPAYDDRDTLRRFRNHVDTANPREIP